MTAGLARWGSEVLRVEAVKAGVPIYAYYRRTLGDGMFAALYTGEERKANPVRQAAYTRPDCVHVTEVNGKVDGGECCST